MNHTNNHVNTGSYRTNIQFQKLFTPDTRTLVCIRGGVGTVVSSPPTQLSATSPSLPEKPVSTQDGLTSGPPLDARSTRRSGHPGTPRGWGPFRSDRPIHSPRPAVFSSTGTVSTPPTVDAVCSPVTAHRAVQTVPTEPAGSTPDPDPEEERDQRERGSLVPAPERGGCQQKRDDGCPEHRSRIHRHLPAHAGPLLSDFVTQNHRGNR